MKILNEWFIEAPWGKIALISWGSPGGEPVLLIHGRQDSASTFIPLLELMPEQYYYVGIDMPGNGRSDPFPVGIKITRLHFIAAMEMVLKHLGWESFIFIGHSMGCEQGLFYNAVHPWRIRKQILLDAIPSLQRLQVFDVSEYFKTFYDNYYSNYMKENFGTKLYTREKAIEAVMRARELTREQGELILERNLIDMGDRMFRLSWDNRLKSPAPQNYTNEYYYALFSKNTPPTLLLSASDGAKGYDKGKEGAQKLIADLKSNVANFQLVEVLGGHDVHFTNPDRCAPHILKFLEKDFGRSKL
ncbi:serine hydrolase-like protein 2 [Manduca sexta]|uniref:serine hydrolase-like protein 2 n=1 Tax=Manduca sexta TaxID=7130 RepID=UPI00188DF3E0|nr:serine hydrolase-like protein 2 [Manduca sexta]